LMLVMFGVGVGSLAAMVALTGAMVIEKTMPGGKRLSPFIGIALLLLGLLWFAHPAWLIRAGI
jgi:predicted metal-binding membrane protein